MRWQVISSRMLENEKRDNAGLSCCPYRALKGVKVKERGVLTPACIGTPGPVVTGPALSACPGLQSRSKTSLPTVPITMTSEVFNPNPTIIATSAPTARKRAVRAHHSLWLSDDEDSDTYDSAVDGEPEPIDADEIFGLFSFSLCLPSA